MTYSINWPITVRSAVPFRKLYLPHLRPTGPELTLGACYDKSWTIIMYVVLSTVQRQRLTGRFICCLSSSNHASVQSTELVDVAESGRVKRFVRGVDWACIDSASDVVERADRRLQQAVKGTSTQRRRVDQYSDDVSR